jgi:hypothetical protein
LDLKFNLTCVREEEKVPAIGRRRHSWCCSNGRFSAQMKRFATQSTQTIDEAQSIQERK